MKNVLPTAILVLVIASSSSWAQEAKPNFSGKWNLDVSKSEFGAMPAPDFITHVIEHKEPNLKITTTQKSSVMGESTTLRNLTTDGKENTNRLKTMVGESDVKSTSRWDGARLATAMKLDVQGMAIEISDSWELSADGKVLTVTRQTTGPDGALAQKFVFNKQ